MSERDLLQEVKAALEKVRPRQRTVEWRSEMVRAGFSPPEFKITLPQDTVASLVERCEQAEAERDALLDRLGAQ